MYNITILAGSQKLACKLSTFGSLRIGAHAQARYTVVCLCVCVDCYSCSRIKEV